MRLSEDDKENQKEPRCHDAAVGRGEKRDHEPWILGEVSGVVTIVCIYFFD